MLGEDEQRLSEARALMLEINLGATAIGTGITAHPDYARLVCLHLSELTGLKLMTAPNLIEATQDCGAFVQLSGVLKRVAVKLSKTCNDLRLLSSGPRAGIGDINLPARQAGSSIMPGKVNPVIPEVVNQVAFEVIGNDMTITMAAEGGQLQLNAFEPVIAYSMFRSVRHLSNACTTLTEHCVKGITANEAKLRADVLNSIGLVTALNPIIGYAAATAVAAKPMPLAVVSTTSYWSVADAARPTGRSPAARSIDSAALAVITVFCCRYLSGTDFLCWPGSLPGHFFIACARLGLDV
jgi:aspartate ammonia-lyase